MNQQGLQMVISDVSAVQKINEMMDFLAHHLDWKRLLNSEVRKNFLEEVAF